MDIRLTSDGFRLRKGWFGGPAYLWSDVQKVFGEKVDKLTCEEDFLILHLGGDRWVSLGEFDKGFSALENALIRQLDGFGSGWRQTAAESPAGKRFTVWTR